MDEDQLIEFLKDNLTLEIRHTGNELMINVFIGEELITEATGPLYTAPTRYGPPI